MITTYSYSDLWRIVGATVTRYDLSMKHNGLYLNLPEFDNAFVFLTNDTRQMTDFLGLDANVYEEGFKTLDDVFDWATSCRLFKKKFFEKAVVNAKEQRARDKRPMYKKFMMEWLPNHHLPSDPDEIDAGGSKDKQRILREAIDLFGKQFEYDKAREDYHQLMLRNAIWRQIADGLPLEGRSLGKVMVNLKKRLCWNERDGTFLSPNTSDQVQTSLNLMQSQMAVIVQWALENYDKDT